MITFTSGPTPPEEEIDWQARVAEPLKSLRKKNVDIFSVAAGVPDKRALAAIAGSPARVFDINSVNNLATAIKEESIPIPPAGKRMSFLITVILSIILRSTARGFSMSLNICVQYKV